MQIALQTDPDKKPVKLSMVTTLADATLLCHWLEEAGMNDKSSEDMTITATLIDNCAHRLKVKREIIKTYLVNLKGVSPEIRGPVFRSSLRMASRKADLRRGICPTASPGGIPKPHWAGAYLISCHDFYDEVQSKHKVNMRFLVATGPAAGLVVESAFPRGFLYVMRQDIGATVGRVKKGVDIFYGQYEIYHSNLCQVAVFLQSRQEVYVSKVSATTTMAAYNKKLIRSRVRALSACPFGKQLDCVQCGVTTLQCSRSLWIG